MQTLGNTEGNNNKDAMFDWRSRCQSEDKRKSHISVTSIMTITFIMLLQKENISGFFSICVISFVTFVYILFNNIHRSGGKYPSLSPTLR